MGKYFNASKLFGQVNAFEIIARSPHGQENAAHPEHAGGRKAVRRRPEFSADTEKTEKRFLCYFAEEMGIRICGSEVNQFFRQNAKSRTKTSQFCTRHRAPCPVDNNKQCV